MVGDLITSITAANCNCYHGIITDPYYDRAQEPVPYRMGLGKVREASNPYRNPVVTGDVPSFPLQYVHVDFALKIEF